MKLNSAMTFCYFIYFGIAVMLNPAKNFSSAYSTYKSCSSQVIEKVPTPVAEEKTEVLHSELLFEDF